MPLLQCPATPQSYHLETKLKDLEFAINRHNLCFVDKMPRCEILKCVHYMVSSKSCLGSIFEYKFKKSKLGDKESKNNLLCSSLILKIHIRIILGGSREPLWECDNIHICVMV